ncbi:MULTISPECIES: hypothetical protein [unclassified Wolbachia]|uniref:hypothetical protein n=1 Tax=unclassified Wolbachia TaxID=2640676 RepID=UPI002227DD0E|nr:hypothetical protein [Wolbachia endosymbiont (group A) of Rhinocyllus conicus]
MGVLFSFLIRHATKLIVICFRITKEELRQAYDKKQNIKANKRSYIEPVKKLLLKIILVRKFFYNSD